MKIRNFFKKLVPTLFIVGITLLSSKEVLASPNYGISREYFQLYYEGYVQIQPSYNDYGRHAYQGAFTYKNGSVGNKTFHTNFGKNKYDSNIYSVTGRYYDTLDWGAPQTTFSYNIGFVPASSDLWPVSLYDSELISIED